MSEQKMREEFEDWWNPLLTDSPVHRVSEVDAQVIWQAAKRQDAERIAELEALVREETASANRWHEEAIELRAKLDALEKQEPIWYCCDAIDSEGLNYDEAHVLVDKDGLIDYAHDENYTVSPLYAKPIPATPAIPEGWHLSVNERELRLLEHAAWRMMGDAYSRANAAAQDINSQHSSSGDVGKFITDAKDLEALVGKLRAMLAASPKPPTNEGEV